MEMKKPNLHNAEFLRSAVKESDFPHDPLPQIVFAGKSNVGKSSVINKLLNRKNFARVSAQPGKTIHINYFTIDKAMYLVDLPGYGYAKTTANIRSSWSDLVGGYISERSALLGVVLIMDARRPFMPSDEWVIEFMRNRPTAKMVWLINKEDQLRTVSERRDVIAAVKKRAETCVNPVSVQYFSGLKKTGVEELRATLDGWLGL